MTFFWRFWHRLPLRNKLILYFVPIIMLVILSLIYAGNLSFSYSNFYENTLKAHYRINEFLYELRQNSQLITQFTEKENITVVDLQNSQKKINLLLQQMNLEPTTNQEVKFQMRAINNSFEYYVKKTQEIINLYWEGLPYFNERYKLQRTLFYIEQYVNILQNALFDESQQNFAKTVAEFDFVRMMIFIFIIIVTMIIIRLIVVFANKFTSPIRRLADLSTKIASGDLDVPIIPVPIRYGDEICVLSDAFNKMSKSIKNMVDNLQQKSVLEKKLHEEELAKETAQVALKQAQLISLQSQIKPHFLFNTLNTIQRQAELEDALQTQNLIHSLAALFRFNLLSHQQLVTVEQEVNAVQEYVKLQQKRFGSRIKFVLKIQTDISKLTIPPFMLLTFVENAICHGLEPKIEGGFVCLNIKLRNNNVLYRILDTGIGMESKDRLLTNTEEFDNPNFDGSVHGVGIKNIMYRLHLLYCGKESFTLYSKKGRGSMIIINIPQH